MDIDILRTEITTDPLARRYSGMTDIQVAEDMNTVYRKINKGNVSSSEILNAVDKAEYTALSNADKQLFWNILSIGEVNPFGIEAALLTDAFGAGSTTIVQLGTLRKRSVSRGEELGIGKVREGNVMEARL